MELDIDLTKNRLCIAAWVYGRKYQGWIPLFVYSIKKNYPEYDIKVFIDNNISLGVKKILKRHGLDRMLDIHENVLQSYNQSALSDIEKRCLRWLISGYGLEEYEYVYWGDIDIYIVKEKNTLLHQHISRIADTGMNYSNAIRLSLKDYLKNRSTCNRQHLFRLTGLHFVQTKEYYAKVTKTQGRFIKYLRGSRRSRVIDKVFFRDDERCLWLLNLISSNGFPKGSYELLSTVFRPIHGLHFAIGREYEQYRVILSSSSAHSKEHLKYYEEFCKEYNSDFELRQLILDSSAYIIDTIEMTCKIWKGRLLENGIKTE